MSSARDRLVAGADVHRRNAAPHKRILIAANEDDLLGLRIGTDLDVHLRCGPGDGIAERGVFAGDVRPSIVAKRAVEYNLVRAPCGRSMKHRHLVIVAAAVYAIATAISAQSTPLTIVLTGQSNVSRFR